jgi:hypothetical protein
MSWWEYIPAVISAVGTLVGNNSSNKQNAYQRDINNYNTIQGYQVSMANIASSVSLAQMNAALMMGLSDQKSLVTRKTAQYNADMIRATSSYNDLLYEEELADVYESLDLDLETLHLQRARERGAIEAAQSASGVLMGQDSPGDVIIDQMTMEAMDSFIIQRNADKKANQILNARARSAWEGEMTAEKIIWEGDVEAMSSSMSTRAQAAGSLIEAGITAGANRLSSKYQLDSGLLSGQNTFSSNQTQINNSFAQGMFGAVGEGINTYYRNQERDERNTMYKSLLDEKK